MPGRCVAGFCSNRPTDDISLHNFPKDPVLREKWAKQVRRTRDDWSPSAASLLCSAHFEAECFDVVPSLKESLGLPVPKWHKRRLLPAALPTIFPRGPTPKPEQVKPRTSRALEKRRRVEILQECLSPDPPLSAGEDLEELPADSDETVTSGLSTSVQVCLKPPTRTIGMQFRGKGRSKGVQASCIMVTTGTQTPTEEEPGEVQEEDDNMSVMSTESSGSEYQPSSDEEEMEEDVTTTELPTPNVPPKHAVFLIFWSCLVSLITTWCACPSCGNRRLTWQCKETGTLLKITLQCPSCSHQATWKNQPFFGKTAAGNICLSSAILFAGASVTKVLRVLQHMGVAVMCLRSFFRHQTHVLFEVVESLWKERQFSMLTALQVNQQPIICGGDGRADSPGHCAKYGTYTLMELEETAILDLELVQSNEVGGSYNMEQEGLQRSLDKVQEYVEVGTLVTDRHLGIKKMIREEHPLIKHLYDIWHVAKSVKKKLQDLSRRRGCRVLQQWIGSIINHLYWAVVSTNDENRELAVDKWTSVVQHIHNQHEGFDGLFPKCEHEELEGRELQKQWLKPCTFVSTELEKIVCDSKLCADILKLSPVHQTYYLEAFHSLMSHFAPKMYAFSYKGMQCRVMLAAMHFNENAKRTQRTTREGQNQYTIHFPKYKHGGHIVRKVLEDPSFEYVSDLMERVEKKCRGEKYDGDMLEGVDFPAPVPEPEPLSAACDRPNKEVAIRTHVNRFTL